MTPQRPSPVSIPQLMNEAPSDASQPDNSRTAESSTGRSTSSRKRSKPSGNGDDVEEKKRSRGRPRLDPKDETAADRRRTQVRMAQRTYRQRKDTAIVTLEQKVKDLEQANEDMGKEFMNFYDFFLANGMLNGAPEVAQRLSETTRKFLALARKTAGESSRDDGEQQSPAMLPAPPPTSPPVPTTLATGQETGPGNRRASRQSSTTITSASHSESSATAASSGKTGLSSITAFPSSPRIFNAGPQQPYEVITQPTAENASFPMFDTQAQFPFFDNSFTSPFSTLPAPSSYAWQERTFSRRLQRLALEAGLRLASMQNPPPHRYAAVFGFCLLFESREAIIERLTTGLNRTRDQTLSIWRFPFTNLGGAGFFFPDPPTSGSVMSDGNSIEVSDKAQGLRELFKPSELTGFSMGPFGPDVEATRDERVDHRMRMMYQGFEGDFYDANEVEAYLQQRGILISDGAEFVEAEIDITSLNAGSGPSPSNGSRNLSGRTTLPTSRPDYHNLPGSGTGLMGNVWPRTTSAPMASSSVMDIASMMGPVTSHIDSMMPAMTVSAPPQFSTGMGSLYDSMQPCWTTGAPSPRSTKTRVTIDVSRLLKGEKAHTPGYDGTIANSNRIGRNGGVSGKDARDAPERRG